MAKRKTRRAPDASDESIAQAADKYRRGEKLNRQEKAALRRLVKAREEQQREEHYRTVPKKKWREWSGRQATILNEQAARYGIPIGSALIELPAVVRWLHDFLAANARKLAGIDHADPTIAGKQSEALERKRLADAQIAELRYKRELGEWISRRKVHEGLAVFAGVLRQANETLQREFGREAHRILDEALDDAITALEADLGDDGADQ